jgi:Helix-turn-helix domain
MCFEAVNWAIQQRCENAPQKLVLIMLAHHKNSETGRCDPSNKLLAEETSQTVRAIIKQIQALAKLGYLKIIQKSENNCRLPNQYELKIPVKKVIYPIINTEKMPEMASFLVGSERDARGVMNVVHEGSEHGSPGVVNEMHEGGEQRSPEYKNINTLSLSLSDPEKACLAWAKENHFWAPLMVCDEKFIELYSSQKPNGLKSQYETQLLSADKKDQRNAQTSTSTSEHGNRRLTPAEIVAKANGYKPN